ncbi:MAG: hypothetical protein RR177_00620 [Oscillospiraceae bacterium]
MCCKIVDMREKQVICIKDGTILGCVYDVEVDTCNGKVAIRKVKILWAFWSGGGHQHPVGLH